MNPVVVWTFRGERQFHFLLSRLNRLPERFELKAGLTDRLRMVFPDAATVIVLDFYFGFRQRPDEYILLVDARSVADGNGGTVVVKLASDDRLRVECEAWAHTREAQFGGDEVLMRQGPAYHPHYNHRLIAICYQDAAPHVGLDRQVSLEEAFVGCVRFGTPSVESVRLVFDTLFRSLGRELYRGGRAREREERLTAALELNPDNAGGGRRRSLAGIFEKPRKDDPPPTVATWTAGTPAEVARKVQAETGGVAPDRFLNPLQFFRNLTPILRKQPDSRHAIRLSRGPAHGDLHGRNVLVGLEGDHAFRPAVYDYELMSRDNLIALDFVKLETELKLRAYRYAFPDDGFDEDVIPPADHLRDVQEFEWQLSRRRPAFRPRTESATAEDDRRPTAEADRSRAEPGPTADGPPSEPESRPSSARPSAGAVASPAQRLYVLLDQIRGLAKLHLRPVNPADWEREYFLLLAAYSLYTVRFDQPRALRAAAYVAAGTAAAAFQRLSTPAPPTQEPMP